MYGFRPLSQDGTARLTPYELYENAGLLLATVDATFHGQYDRSAVSVDEAWDEVTTTPRLDREILQKATVGTPSSEGQYGASSVEAPKPDANTTAEVVTIRFAGISYNEIVNDTQKLTSFKATTRSAIAVAANVSVNNVNITGIRAGSIVVDFSIFFASNVPATSRAAVASAIQTNPAVIFDTSFQAAYGITGISVLEQPEVKSSSSAVAIGCGVGIGVGGALLVAAIAAFVNRKRKMNLQTNNPPMLEQDQNAV
eukprot:gene12978-13107_t